MSRARGIDALLMQQMGLDPSTVGSSLISRGLQARMSELGLHDPAEYEQLLGRSPEELQNLIEEIVVPESWFFRDDRPFGFLREHVQARWLSAPDGRPFRALSLPCAGGEEPYSIAMALLDLGLPPERFRVDAVDISTRCLERARRAVYGNNAFRGGDLSFRARYFHERAGKYELDALVRDRVRLIQGNLVDPGLLASEPAYDVVFCRNLLIYLTDDARAQASANLGRLLDPAGILFLGHAERLDAERPRFESVGDKGSFAYRHLTPQPPALHLGAPSPPRPKTLRQARATFRPTKADPPTNWPTTPPLNPPTRPVAPRPVREEKSNPEVPAQPPPPELLDEAAGLADQGRYDEAVALCERSLRESGPSARAFFLLGMSRQAAGDRDQAEAFFRKAVYLDSQHDEALLALALLAERRGDGSTAVSYRRRAERVLSRKGTP